MTVYGKIENGQFITAYNGYNGIIGFADNIELMLANAFKPYEDDLVSKYYAKMAEIQGDELVDITGTEEYKTKIAAEKEKQFLNNFIKISIGWLRKSPKGYSSIVEAMNSALNVVYINGNLPAGVLTIYPEPDFKTVENVEEYLEKNKFTNKAMTSEEFGALFVEFMTAWNKQEHL